MKRAVFLLVLCSLGLVFGIGVTHGQDAQTCSTFVQQALTTVQDACGNTGRNQACYGNFSLEATPREGISNFAFDQRGDIANVGDLQTLRLNGLNPQTNTWGIALMKIQANLPDTLPGQNVTFLMFGDVEIDNAVSPGSSAASIQLTANSNINIRQRPSTEDPVIGSLSKGEIILANGRNDNSTWFRIQIPDSDSLGWVFGNLVTPTGDPSTLSVVDAANQEVPFNPMQAFYFRTGVTATDCTEAPPDGIIIQTPEGAGEIKLRANDVDLELGSTALLKAQPGSNMSFSILEGGGAATADGERVEVPAGSWVQIPIDDSGNAAGAPSQPMPYTEDALSNLPIELLPEQITIAPPMTAEDLATPTPAGSAAGALPGMDMSAFEGMDPTLFCNVMNQVFSQSGMSKDDYIALINQSRAFVDAQSQADFDQFLAMLQACE